MKGRERQRDREPGTKVVRPVCFTSNIKQRGEAFSAMVDNWHFIRGKESEGPVSFEKLKSMAREGWLRAEDLVWRPGMTQWTAAGKVHGLCRPSISQMLRQKLWRDDVPPELSQEDENVRPPALPEKPATRRSHRVQTRRQWINWADSSPKHVLAACGIFLAVLGIAFTTIARSRLALAFTLSGLFITAVGLSSEMGRLVAEAIDNIVRLSREAAERRLRTKELALEKQRLDLEAARLAHQDRALESLLPEKPVQVRDRTQARPLPAPAMATPTSNGNMVVITQQPTRLWSPGLAAVLSMFLPGLGQLYKGQIINGCVWFVLVMWGYAALILPGLLLHFFCVLGALSGNPWGEGKTMVVRQ